MTFYDAADGHLEGLFELILEQRVEPQRTLMLPFSRIWPVIMPAIEVSSPLLSLTKLSRVSVNASSVTPTPKSAYLLQAPAVQPTAFSKRGNVR